MNGRYNRIKGCVFEREIARFFRECGWKKAARNLREVQAHHAVRHQDLENTAPFAVQCKNTEKKAADRQLLQGIRLDVKKGLLFPLLVRKRNSCQPTVTIALEDLDELLATLRMEQVRDHLHGTTLLTMPLSNFRPLLSALKKARLYAKEV